MSTPRAKKKTPSKKAPTAVAAAPSAEKGDDDVATNLLAEALGRHRIAPPTLITKFAADAPSPSPKQPTGNSGPSVDADEFPLTARAGGHDLTADNWAARSQRMAALARKNEVRALGSRGGFLDLWECVCACACACARGCATAGSSALGARLRRCVRSSQIAELEAKIRLGMLSRKEQAKLGPSLLAKAEAEAAARQDAASS